MSYTKEDLLGVAERVRLDLRDAQVKLADLAEMIADSALPATRAEGPTCPRCGHLRTVRNEQQLEEHMRNVHE